MYQDVFFEIHPIKHNIAVNLDYYCGTASDNRLVLMKYGATRMEVIWFRDDGSCIDSEIVSWELENLSDPSSPLPAPVQKWMADNSFNSQVIRVHPFSIRGEFTASISLLMGGDVELLNYPCMVPSVEERQERYQEILNWLELRRFVLHWETEEYMQEHGPELVSPIQVPTKKQYSVRSNNDFFGNPCYWAGACDDGNQQILGIYKNELLTVNFDSDGVLLDYYATPLEAGPSSFQIQQYSKQVGWKEKPITIQKFALSGYCVYLDDLPSWAAAFLHDPFVVPMDNHNEMFELITEWIQDDNFVVCWLDPFEVNSDGTHLPPEY